MGEVQRTIFQTSEEVGIRLRPGGDVLFQPHGTSPEDGAEPIELLAADGARLRGWLLPAAGVAPGATLAAGAAPAAGATAARPRARVVRTRCMRTFRTGQGRARTSECATPEFRSRRAVAIGPPGRSSGPED
jgi:hypothetical protein